jgi:hypothetical protein
MSIVIHKWVCIRIEVSCPQCINSGQNVTLWGSHSSVSEDSGHLGLDTVSLCEWLLTLCGNTVPHLQGQALQEEPTWANKGNVMCVVWSSSGWQSLSHCLISQFWTHQPCSWLLVSDQTVLHCTSYNVPFPAFLTLPQLAHQPYCTDTDYIIPILSPLLSCVGCFSWTAWALKMKAQCSFEMSGTTHLVTWSYPTGPQSSLIVELCTIMWFNLIGEYIFLD